MFIDTHCHLQDNLLIDRIDSIVSDSKKSGVKYLIVNGCNYYDCFEAISLSKKYHCIFVAIGIHPTENETIDVSILENLINTNKVVAIGEIGLDYYYGRQNEKEQKEKFIQQLDLAVKYNLPVIIHNRNATDDIYNILKLYKGKLRGIIHCFSGSIETANMFIKLGFLLGIGGIVTFKNNDNLRTVLKHVALDNIVLETDSPYLTPVPFRKNHNEPKYIIETAKVLACIYNMDLLDIGKITSSNALNLFKLNS